MATNFAYRKRQLELEKKRKKEEKLKRKQERGAGTPGDEAQVQDLSESAADETAAPEADASGSGTRTDGEAAPEGADR